MTPTKEKDELLKIVYYLRLKYNAVHGYDTDLESLQKKSRLSEDIFNVAFQEIESDNYLAIVGNDGNGMIPLVITDLGNIFFRAGGYRAKEKREKIKNTKEHIIKNLIPFFALVVSIITTANQCSIDKRDAYQQKILDSLSRKVYTLDSIVGATNLKNKPLKLTRKPL